MGKAYKSKEQFEEALKLAVQNGQSTINLLLLMYD